MLLLTALLTWEDQFRNPFFHVFRGIYIMSLQGASTSICLLTVLLIVGCGSDKGDATKARLKAMAGGELKVVVPVSGTVLVDGQPVTGVLLQLWSSNTSEKPRKSVVAGADGKYCWSTYTPCDGLEPGAYKLTFKHLKDPKKEKSEDLFKGRYSDVSNSKYELTVEAGMSQQDVDYELNSK